MVATIPIKKEHTSLPRWIACIPCFRNIASNQSVFNLKPKARQPRFHFEDPVALDFEGPTVADPNVVVPGILGDRDLEGRSQLLQEETPVARNFFDSGSDPRTVLSVIGYPKQRQCTNKRRRETNGETMLLRENPFKLLLTPCRALRYSSNTNG